MRRRVSKPAAIFCLLLLSAEAGAWGALGHRLIGDMAEQRLTAHSQQVLRALIGEQSLADVSVWLDEERLTLRRQHPGSERWHYDNWPVCEVDDSPVAYCQDGNCASQAYARSLIILRDSEAPPVIRLNALRVVVHVLEDIHQPLHAADHADRGGNEISVRWGSSGRSGSLHSAWDTEFVKVLTNGRPLHQVAEEWLAQTNADVDEIERGDIKSWLMESHDLSRSVAYGQLPGFACSVDSPTRIALPSQYMKTATAVIKKQLLRASLRLADVLNHAL